MPADFLTTLEWQIGLTFVVVLLLFAALVRDWFTPDVVMLSGLVVLVLGGVISPSEALGGFADSALLTIAALFVVAAAVRSSGAFGFLYPLMMPRSGNTRLAILRIAFPSAFISAFINNTPIVAILAPLVQRWGARSKIFPSKLLMPMTFATTLGGMSTLIGTSTNLLVAGMLTQAGLRSFSLWELAWVGVPAALVGIAYLTIAAPRILPEGGQAADFNRQELRSYQFELRLPDDSPLVGRSVEAAGLRALEGAYLAHIRREGEILGPIRPDRILRERDVLAFVGNPAVLDDLLERGTLIRVVDHPGTVPVHLPLFEAVIAAGSNLAGKTLRETDFRERFQAVVLGIHRQGKRLSGSIGRTELEPGDLLLVEARPGFEAAALATDDFYLVAPLERTPIASRRKAPLALGLLLAVIVTATLGWVPLVIASIAAALLTILTRTITATEARRSLDLTVLLVIGAGLGVGRAIEASGMASLVAEGLVDLMMPFGAIGALAAVYAGTSVLTEFLSNAAAAVLVFPIAIAAAAQVGANPIAFAIAVAIAASAGFATPIGYQTNLMVMGPGGYRFADYLRVGIPLNIIVMAIAIPVIALVWM